MHVVDTAIFGGIVICRRTYDNAGAGDLILAQEPRFAGLYELTSADIRMLKASSSQVGAEWLGGQIHC